MITKNMTMAKNVTITASIVLCLVGSLSCTTHPHLVIHRSDTLTITLRELPTTYPLIAPFRYSHVVDEGNTFALLESLTYESGSGVPLADRQQHHVFTKHQAESLAPELSKALNLALPHEVAAFSVSDTKQPRQHTKGLAFVHGDELHVIIEELPRSWHTNIKNPDSQQVSRWALLPRDGQRHYAAHQGTTGTKTNWIVAPIR